MSKVREPVIFRYFVDDVLAGERTYSRFVYRPDGEPPYIGARRDGRRMLVSDRPPVVEVRGCTVRIMTAAEAITATINKEN